MHIREFYNNQDFRTFLAAMTNDRALEAFVTEADRVHEDASISNMAPYITSKFNRFISDLTLRNITCQNRTLDMDSIIQEGKILLFHFGKGRFGDQAAGLLASQLISRIRSSVMKRGSNPQHRPFFLYVDEFQVLADDRFAELLAESRKFGLSLTLAHQYAQQLPPSILQAILGNVGTSISFRVGALDSELLEPLFSPTFNRKDLMNLPNYCAYVRSFGELGVSPFSLETMPAPTHSSPELAQYLRRDSRTRHGRDRIEVEAEIDESCASLLKFL
jgi:hypothetical protein